MRFYFKKKGNDFTTKMKFYRMLNMNNEISIWKKIRNNFTTKINFTQLLNMNKDISF